MDGLNLVSPGRSCGKTTLEFAQKAFILADDRLLLVRKSDHDPYHPGRWEVPGGRLRVSADLDLEHHIRREVWEEVGIKIDPGPPFHLWDWSLPPREGGGPVRVIAVARHCRPSSVDVTIENQTPDDHLSDAAWVGLDKVLDYELIPGVRPVMEHFLGIHSG